jgi:hypothetical protein
LNANGPARALRSTYDDAGLGTISLESGSLAELPQSALILPLHVNNYFWLTVSRSGPDMIRIFARIKRMFIEITVFVAFVVAISAAVVKIYEWRQDVLYGPYIGRRSDQNRKAN